MYIIVNSSWGICRQRISDTVREMKETKILDKKANDCALQHIKTFRDQAAKGVIADFGEPCQDCIHRRM